MTIWDPRQQSGFSNDAVTVVPMAEFFANPAAYAHPAGGHHVVVTDETGAAKMVIHAPLPDETETGR